MKLTFWGICQQLRRNYEKTMKFASNRILVKRRSRVKTELKKLALNQETLKNLTQEELRNIEGGHFSIPARLTCPECAPPAGKQE